MGAIAEASVRVDADMTPFNRRVESNVKSSMARAGKAAETEAEAAGALLGDKFNFGFRRKFQKAGSDMFSSVIGIGTAVGIASLIPETLKLGSAFQATMAHMQSLTDVGKLTKAQFNDLGQEVLNLAGKVGYSPVNLSDALYHIESNMTGMVGAGKMFATSEEQQAAALKATQIAAEGAQIGHANLVDVTNALGAIIASGTVKVGGYNQAMGEMLKTVGSGDMTMQDLAAAMGTGIMATASTFGLKMKDVGAALAVFGDNNIRGTKAATYLKMALQDLGKPISGFGKNGEAVLEKFGTSATKLNELLRTKGLGGAIEELRNKFIAAGLPMDQWGTKLTEIFTKRAGPGIAILMTQFDRLQGKYADIGEAGDHFADQWATRQHTMDQQVANTKERMVAWLTEIGMKLMPIVASGLEGFNKALDYIGGHKDVQVILEGLAVGAAAAAASMGTAAIAAGLFNASWLPFLAAGAAIGAAIFYIVEGSGKLHDILAPLIIAVGAFFAAFKGYAIIMTVVDAMKMFNGMMAVQQALAAMEGIEIGVIGSALAVFQSRLMASAAAQWLLNVAMDANPIGLIIAGLVAVGVALTYFFTKTKLGKEVWKDIEKAASFTWKLILEGAKVVGQFLQDVWKKIGHQAKEVWDGLVTGFNIAVKILKPIVKAYFEYIKIEFMVIIAVAKFIWNAVVEIFKFGWEIIKVIFQTGAAIFYIAMYPLIKIAQWVWNMVSDGAQALWTILKTGFNWLNDNVFQPVFHAAWDVASWAWGQIKGAAQDVWSFLSTGFNWLNSNVFQPIWHGLVEAGRWAWDNIKGAAADTWNWIQGVWNGAVGWFSSIGGSINKALSSAWDGIESGFSSVVDTLKRAWNSFVAPLNSGLGAISDVSKSLGGPAITAKIPTFAKGTDYAPGGLSLVGENGPELVNLPRGSQVKTADETQKILGAKGDTNVTINQNFYGPTTSSDRAKELDWNLRFMVSGGRRLAAA